MPNAERTEYMKRYRKQKAEARKRYIDEQKLGERAQKLAIIERQQAAERASSQRRFRFLQRLEELRRQVEELRTRPYYSKQWGN